MEKVICLAFLIKFIEVEILITRMSQVFISLLVFSIDTQCGNLPAILHENELKVSQGKKLGKRSI